MSRYRIEPDELWPVMRWQKPGAEELGVEVPDHLVNDLKMAHRQLNQVTRMIVHHLLETEQWRKEDTPVEWLA